MERLLREYPDENGSWREASCNIPINFVIENPDQPWNFQDMSINPHVNDEFFLANKTIGWNLELLVTNPGISTDLAMSFYKEPWFRKSIVHRTDIDPGIIEKFQEFGPDDKEITLKNAWDWQFLSLNPSIKMDTIKKFQDYWWYPALSRNPNLDKKFVEDNINKEWSWYWLSRHPAIDMDFVKENIKKKWDYNALSKRKDYTPEFIREYFPKDYTQRTIPQEDGYDELGEPKYIETKIERGATYNYLSNNPNIYPDDVKSEPDKPWSKSGLCLNPNFPPQFFEQEKFKMDPIRLTDNPNLSIEYLEEEIPGEDGKRIDLFWDFWGLSEKKFITPEFILKYPSKDWDMFSYYKNRE